MNKAKFTKSSVTIQTVKKLYRLISEQGEKSKFTLDETGFINEVYMSLRLEPIRENVFEYILNHEELNFISMVLAYVGFNGHMTKPQFELLLRKLSDTKLPEYPPAFFQNLVHHSYPQNDGNLMISLVKVAHTYGTKQDFKNCLSEVAELESKNQFDKDVLVKIFAPFLKNKEIMRYGKIQHNKLLLRLQLGQGYVPIVRKNEVFIPQTGESVNITDEQNKGINFMAVCLSQIHHLTPEINGMHLPYKGENHSAY